MVNPRALIFGLLLGLAACGGGGSGGGGDSGGGSSSSSGSSGSSGNGSSSSSSSSSSSGSGSLPDTQSPSVKVNFPPADSLTDKKVLRVSGVVTDNVKATSVKVNNVEATIFSDEIENSDGSITAPWWVDIPLTIGQITTIEVVAGDDAGNIVELGDTISIVQKPYVNVCSESAVLDTDTLNYYTKWGDEVFVTNLDTGTSQPIVLDSSFPGDVVIDDPLVYDQANKRLIFKIFDIDNDVDILAGINVETGGYMPLVTQADFPYFFGKSGVYRSANNTLYYPDAAYNRLFTVNLDTGVFSLFSHNGDGKGEAFGNRLNYIVLDEANSRLLMHDSYFASNEAGIRTVDISDGTRGILISDTNGTPPLNILSGMAFDPATNMAYSINDNERYLVKINTGIPSATTVNINGPAGFPEFTPDWLDIRSVDLDVDNNRVVVMDCSYDVIAGIDLTTGDREILYSVGRGEGIRAYGLGNFAYDGVDAIYALETVFQDQPQKILAVNIVSGDRSVVSSAGTSDTFYMSSPKDIVLAQGANRLLATNGDADLQIVSVDIETGDRAAIARVGDGKGVNLDDPGSIQLLSGNRAVVADNGLSALVEVDLVTGARQVISQTGVGVGDGFGEIVGLLTDTNLGVAYVLDATNQALIRVDLSNGNRTPAISDCSLFGTNLLSYVSSGSDMAFGENKETIYLTGYGSGSGSRGDVIEVTLGVGCDTKGASLFKTQYFTYHFEDFDLIPGADNAIATTSMGAAIIMNMTAQSTVLVSR